MMNGHKFALCILGFAIAASAADTRVADAAEQGDRKAVSALIAQKADINGAQGDGSTALHWAAQKDDLDLAKILLAAGAKIDATTRVGAATPLFMACRNGNAAMIELLLKSGADPNSLDEHATTPLMMAAAAGNPDAVQVLLEHGANPNAREGPHGQTALMFAAALGRADAIRVLTAHGADPSIASKAAKAPHVPSSFEQIQNAAQKASERPAAPTASAGNDRSQLDALAVSLGFKSAEYRAGSPEVAQLQASLQKLAAKVDDLEKKLAKPGEEGGGRPVRERGATEIGGMTPLLFAAREGYMDAARALIEGGADVNQASPGDKSTPIVMAAGNGHFDLAKFFLDYGADPNMANDIGLTPLYAAVDLQWSAKGWFPSPNISQEKLGYLEFMKALLDAGANPNARIAKKPWFRTSGDHSWIDTAGSTAFVRAAQSLDLTAMRLLLAHGADPDIPTAGGDTALMVACGIGWGYHYSVNSPEYTWMDTAKFLIQLGGDVNAADGRGYTPLHGAAYIGNDELIRFLVDKGADVKAVAKDKNTVADMANGPTRFGIPHPETVTMLEKLGSANSHNCRSDQCLVNPQEARKPTGAQQ
jgi:ankyrin repeat protein